MDILGVIFNKTVKLNLSLPGVFKAFPFTLLFVIGRGITPDLHFFMAQKLMLNQQQ